MLYKLTIIGFLKICEILEVKTAETSKTFGINLNTMLDKVGVAPSGFGRSQYLVSALGVGVATANKWLRGAQVPEIERMVALRKLLDCSFDDLLMPPDERRSHIDLDTQDIFMHIKGYNFSRKVSMCPQNPETIRPDRIYALEVSGDRMEPFVISGDVVCFTSVSAVEQDGVFVFFNGMFYLIRRVSISISGSAVLISENKHYRSEEIALPIVPSKPGDLRVVGKVFARVLIGR